MVENDNEILRLRDRLHDLANKVIGHEYRLTALEKQSGREWSWLAKAGGFVVGLAAVAASVVVIVHAFVS